MAHISRESRRLQPGKPTAVLPRAGAREAVIPARGPGRVERVLEAQNQILKLIAGGRPTVEVLEALTRKVEDLAPPALCSVLFLDDGRLLHGAAPSLPAAYCLAVDGTAIGPDVGSCGTAAYRREPVVVRDIASDPLWTNYREFALSYGLRACWSQPILTEDRTVLGTFALYYLEPREPGPEDWELLESMAQLVRVLLERDKRERALDSTLQSLDSNERSLSDRIHELEQTRERLQQKTAQLEQLATDLTQARNEAATASRMKSEFLANMSHELRTPLNAIIGFSDIIMSETLGPVHNETYKSYAKDINDSGQHLLMIIGEVLDLARIEAGRFELSEVVVDLGNVAAGCVRLMRERSRAAGLELVASLPSNMPFVFADEIKIKQVLLNLLSNAVKFTPRGGRIVIEADVDGAGGVRIRVRDTGIGMRPEDIPLALEPFRQVESLLSRKYEGTGLGLPLAKAIVEHHGGTLSIESEMQKGTTVTVALPPARTIATPGRAGS